MNKNFSEQIYAGVLGKLLGVYLGRPVEGWQFADIREQFGDVYNYQNKVTGAPLIVPDDDISGTFVFYRALADNNFDINLTAKQIGDTWLNYIVEDQTILWWGGLSRSTEHTAFLRLKEGVEAPRSGSAALNGKSISEQIGSQIFIDTWALMNPNNPALTAKMAREAASVSHDGIAVEAAVFLAVMESLAFVETDIFKLIEQGLAYTESQELKELVAAISEVCAQTDDWLEVRDWIALHHGYDKYPGGCPMVTNHLVVIMALLMAKDDFHQSIMIATSAGWDTDCNAGNVGCLNAIRLGLECFDQAANLRKDVADRMYVISADGGSCVTDAVVETRKLLTAHAAISGGTYEPPAHRYSFEFPGSVQGFISLDGADYCQALTGLTNALADYHQSGLLVSFENLGPGVAARFGIDTFVDLQPKGKDGTSYFDVVGSPNLYSGQTVEGAIDNLNTEAVTLHVFVDYFDENDHLKTSYGSPIELSSGINQIVYEVPDTGGRPIYRLGFQLTAKSYVSGNVIVKYLDFDNEPTYFRMGSAKELTPSVTPWTTNTSWMQTFVSSAKNFHPDFMKTFSISHLEENGVVTTGLSTWSDYTVSSKLTFSFQEGAGLVARAKGHRRYYAARLKDNKAQLIKRQDSQIEILAESPFNFDFEDTYQIGLTVKANTLAFHIDDQLLLTATDDTYTQGGCGFVVDRGCILAEEFIISKE